MNTTWKACAYVMPVSAAAIGMEIAFSRFFSVMFEYHYSFLLISIAIIGLGLGGVWMYFDSRSTSFTLISESDRFNLEKFPLWMAYSAVGFVLVLSYVPAARNVPIAAFLAIIPFFFAGMALAGSFMRLPEQSTLLYAADLSGAVLGTVAALTLLRFGAVNFILLTSFTAALPTFLFRGPEGKFIGSKIHAAAAVAAVLLLLIFNLTSLVTVRIPFSDYAFKEMGQMLHASGGKAKVLATRWSAFGRTDLVFNSERPNEMVLFVDGTAGSVMQRTDGSLQALQASSLPHSSGFFPLSQLKPQERNSMLVIGAGGGKDVLLGRLAGVEDITAVEVNGDLVELVQDYEDFNGRVYSGMEGIQVKVDEGRNFIRSIDRKYDIIMLSLPVTKTSRSPEGFALTENYLFTEESILDYLDHLTPEGRLIVVSHSENEVFRLIFTALSALETQGISYMEAMQRMYSLGNSMLPVFVLTRRPISAGESQQLHLQMHRRGFTTKAPYIPNIEQFIYTGTTGAQNTNSPDYMLHEGLYRLARGEISPAQLRSYSELNLSPVSDDRPFFYHFRTDLPRVVTMILAASLLLVLALWISSFSKHKALSPQGYHPFAFVFAFTALGNSFMLAEIPLIQKYILFLGQPVYSMGILLISLLAGAAAGSAVGGFAARRIGAVRVLKWAALFSGIAVLLHLFFLDTVFSNLMGTSIAMRFTFSAAFITPMGFFLGIPFPMFIRLLGEYGASREIARVWGLNSISSVTGSTLAIAVSLTAGYSFALFISAVLYFMLGAIGIWGGFNGEPMGVRQKGSITKVRRR
jgi:spermidine synthase